MIPEKEHFQEILENKTAEYVELELKPYFGSMIGFLNQLNFDNDLTKVEIGSLGSLYIRRYLIDVAKYEKIITEFHQNWKAHLQKINTSIISSFPNFQNGSRVLEATFTQLLVYYKKFMAEWDKKFVTEKAGVQPIGIQMLMQEMRKFKSNF